MALSGETIDYGPCAFMDAYDPATVFSSIDHGGRYAYGNQPPIAQWNLARLAEAMLPLFADGTDQAVERATAALEHFAERFEQHWLSGMRSKLGLFADEPEDNVLVADLLAWMEHRAADFTNTFRTLSGAPGVDEHGDSRPRLQGVAWPMAIASCAAAAVERGRRGPDAAAQPGVHPAQSQSGGSARGRNRSARLLGDGTAARRIAQAVRLRSSSAGFQQARDKRWALPHVLRHVNRGISARQRATIPRKGDPS